VEYHVGQVVKHKHQKWRGVIIGWDIEQDKNDGQLSSLTTKQYSLPNVDSAQQNDTNKFQYTVLVDFNDAQGDGLDDGLDEGIIFGKAVTLENQDDLTLVEDACLQRICNNLIKGYFTKFDGGNNQGHFVPNNALKYMYPMDRFCHDNTAADDVNLEEEASSVESKPPVEQDKSSLAIVEGINEIGRRLLLPLEVNGQEKGTDGDTSALKSSLLAESYAMMVDSNAQQAMAKLYHLHVKIKAMLWMRKVNQQHIKNINFSLGDIVTHKIYGFRGMVAAWE
jgi:hemimethylated DNA binding protein